MHDLFKAFFFKLKRDLTFRITLFIGLGLAVALSVIFFLVDLVISNLGDTGEFIHMFGTGQNLLLFSLSPVQNFGLAIPINLICFIVLEFTHGTIRNKIIAGNSKAKIYLSLFLSGLVFTLALIVAYAGLSCALGCAFGKFDPNGTIFAGAGTGNIDPEYIWRFLLIALLCYISIAAFTTFFAALFRNIGPSIPVVIIVLMGLYMSAYIFGLLGDFAPEFNHALMYINPLYSLYACTTKVVGETQVLKITDEAFFAGIGSNLIYTAIFVGFGTLIFAKRDVK